MKIHIFGASGSGVTTLAASIAAEAVIKHLDVDDYFWIKTNPQFTTKRSAE